MKVTAGTLNVRSGPDTTFRTLSQLSAGAHVEVLERRGDWVWVSPARGWVHSAYLAPDLLMPPVGLPAIHAMFGEPG